MGPLATDRLCQLDTVERRNVGQKNGFAKLTYSCHPPDRFEDGDRWVTTTRAYASKLTDEQFSARYQEVVDRAVAVKLKRDRKGEHQKAITRN